MARSPGVLRSVELMRFVAALSVVISHMISGELRQPSLGRFALVGDFEITGTVGVEFFFVLSGMVMALAHGASLATPRGSSAMWRFWWRRACRIYPLYWLVLAEILIRLWPALPTDPLHLADWISLAPTSWPALPPVAWTLRQELVFYFVFGLALLPRLGQVLLPAWGIGVIAVNLGLTPRPPEWAVLLFSQFVIEFLIGLGVGWALSRPTQTWNSRPRLVVVVGVLLLATEIAAHRWGLDYGGVDARAGYGAAFGLILFGTVSLERRGMVRPGRWTLIAGAASYPLYLSYLPVMDRLLPALAPYAQNLGILGIACILFIATILIAVLLAYGVDQPIQRVLRGRRLGRQDIPAAPV